MQNAPEWAAGRRAVTYSVTYIDGQETGRDVIDMTTIEPPHARTSL